MDIRRRTAAWAAVFALVSCRTGGDPLLRAAPVANPTFLARDVSFLAGDALEGRGTGTAGNDSARAWIARRMEQLQLEPLFVASDCPGHCPPSFVQPFVARMSGAARNGLPAALATANVGGMIRGSDPALRGQWVILGAHYDHLGRRAFGARDPQLPDAIRNGADDNASGVAAILELARLLRTRPPRRSVAILAFSAEELGLLGSEYLVTHPPLPLDSVQAMLNFDMVGRLRDDKLMVYGTATASELPAAVNQATTAPAFKLTAIGDGEGPSDHASFYRRNLPVLHFFTDAHDDYHTSTDDADKINAAGMQRVVAFAERIARTLADRPTHLTFVRAPATATRTAAARSGGPQPSMGTIPDMGAGDVPGLRLSGVSPGSAAEHAGLRTGDVIVEFDGQTITDLQSYSDALYSHKPGDEVGVTVLRGGERMTVRVTLGRRGG